MKRLCVTNHPNPLAKEPWITVSEGMLWEVAGDGLVLVARRISQTVNKTPRQMPKSVLDFLAMEPAGFRSTGKVLWRLAARARARKKVWRNGCLEAIFDSGKLGGVWIDQSTLLLALSALRVEPDEPCRIHAGERFVRIFGSDWRIVMLLLIGPQTHLDLGAAA